MWQFIANLILRNRFLIIGILTLMTVFFGYHAITGLKLDSKYGILLPNNSKAKIDYERFKELFGEDGGTLVVAIQTDSLYTERNFLKWKELGDSILQYDGVQSIVSEATLFTIHNNVDEEKFEAHRVFSDTKYAEKSIDSIKREIKNNPLYDGFLYNDSTNVSLMLIGVDESFLGDQKKANVVLDIEKVAEFYEPYFGKMHFTGLPHLRVVIGKRVVTEMYIFIALLVCVTSLLLYLFFRSIRVVLMCNLVVAVAVVWSMGTIAWFGFHITVIMALIPPLMIVIGIPNCIYLMTKYHQEIKEHGNKVKALTRVIKKIGTATFLTNLTTALGFLTFISTFSDKLMEFGISAAVNIILVFILSISILPIIISLSKSPKPRHLKHLERRLAVGLLDYLVKITSMHRPWVYVSTVAIIIFSIAGLLQIKATGNLTGDLPEGHQISTDLKFVERNFGGSIPFEILVEYKEPGRLFKKETLERIDQIEQRFGSDSLFTKFISYADLIKVVNMAYYGNNPEQYKIISSRDKRRLKSYMDNFNMTNANGGGFTISELVDTTNRTLRIRAQMRDIGSYEISDKVDSMRLVVDSILNPDKRQIEKYYTIYSTKGKKNYIDSILYGYGPVYNSLTETLAEGDSDKQYEFDSDPELVKSYYNKEGFNLKLRKAIDHTYYNFTMTGASVVASEGTKYMVLNLFTSLLFAIISISILMAILFRSWRMVLVSLIPNMIPLLFTAGVMGWTGIPLKPSTLLIFSIAFGISVDDTIHYLAKYRQELKMKRWDIKQCAISAIRESGLGMFYTSIVLFCGFSMFAFSQFGGTKALGMLISLTLLIAMITNLVLLPTLLLTLDNLLTTKSFEEPYFDAYAEESEIDWENLDLLSEVDDQIGSDDEVDDLSAGKNN